MKPVLSKAEGSKGAAPPPDLRFSESLARHGLSPFDKALPRSFLWSDSIGLAPMQSGSELWING